MYMHARPCTVQAGGGGAMDHFVCIHVYMHIYLHVQDLVNDSKLTYNAVPIFFACMADVSITSMWMPLHFIPRVLARC